MCVHALTHIHACIHTYIHACTHAYIQAGRPAEGHRGRQTDKRTYVHTYIATCIHTYKQTHKYEYVLNEVSVCLYIYITGQYIGVSSARTAPAKSGAKSASADAPLRFGPLGLP